jgi:hypothetical protein
MAAKGVYLVMVKYTDLNNKTQHNISGDFVILN